MFCSLFHFLLGWVSTTLEAHHTHGGFGVSKMIGWNELVALNTLSTESIGGRLGLHVELQLLGGYVLFDSMTVKTTDDGKGISVV
tara:strand:+ start:427 stop:681 length:255 start_codon:yes stop_codon:yes gene_type:complete